MFPVHAITQISVKGGRLEEQIIYLRDSLGEKLICKTFNVLINVQSIKYFFLGRVSMLIWLLANVQRDDADRLSLTKKQTNNNLE